MPSQQQARVLAIITARGGSKRLPNKNVRPIAGKPLIAYTIDAALKARLLDRTVVSTDDRGIADLALKHGSDVPFMRPEELARDDTASLPVLIHAVEWLAEHDGYRPDYVMLLQPTSPLRRSEDIDNCIKLALEKSADSVVSLCEAKHHPYWMKQVGEDGLLLDFLPLDGSIEQAYGRHQDLPPVYAINGAIYLIKREILLERHTLYPDCTYVYIMPPDRSLDIDTLWDLEMAESVLKGRIHH